MRSARGPRHGPRGLLAYAGAMTYTLVLLRHGESDWNAKNLFTGWVDVPLTEKGEAEAIAGGELMKEAGIRPDVVHTSLQRRAIATANLALDAADLHWIPVKRDWRLNERHYGALQGMNKSEIREKYGEEKFMAWRRSYDTPPPEIEFGTEFSQDQDPQYADLGDQLPKSECLKDVVERFLSYWEDGIKPDLVAGRTVLLAAHGNSLRALAKYLDGISDEEISGLNIPTGQPLVYELDENFSPLRRAGATSTRSPRRPPPRPWPTRARSDPRPVLSTAAALVPGAAPNASGSCLGRSSSQEVAGPARGGHRAVGIEESGPAGR